MHIANVMEAEIEAPQLACLTRITKQDLRKMIMPSPTKSYMLDPLPTWLLKDPGVRRSVLPAVTAAINTSLISSIVPHCVKNAIIISLLKKPGLEVVVAQIIERMNRHRLHDAYQSADRAGHSIETALVMIKNDADMALD